jgi:hypothetical protein
MPRCGSTLDGNSVLPWTRGDFRGVWEADQPTPGAPRRPSQGGDFQGIFNVALRLHVRQNSVPPLDKGDFRGVLGVGCASGLAKPITTTP